MSKKSATTDPSSSEINDETSSSEERKRKASKKATKKDSIKNYVTDVLTKQEKDDEQQPSAAPTQIKIDTHPDAFRDYENVSAFRRYQTGAEGTSRSDRSSSSDDEIRRHTQTEEVRQKKYLAVIKIKSIVLFFKDEEGELEDSISDLNLDPNPIREIRESHEQVYKQKVYLRQLQPPTPQPIEIQVQEVLVKSQTPKPPIHVRVAQPEPRTPSPIVIKTAPPQPPSMESTEPIIYNKYLPPPKQPPQQVTYFISFEIQQNYFYLFY
jgi:hypothetical protein